MTIYNYVQYAYTVIFLYFIVMLFYKILTGKNIWVQITAAISVMPFILRVLGIK